MCTEIGTKSRKRNSQIVGAQIDGVETIDAGIVAVRGKPDAGFHTRQSYTRTRDHSARGIEYCARNGSTAGLSMRRKREHHQKQQSKSRRSLIHRYSPLKAVSRNAIKSLLLVLLYSLF